MPSQGTMIINIIIAADDGNKAGHGNQTSM